jgi:hypothetical protein
VSPLWPTNYVAADRFCGIDLQPVRRQLLRCLSANRRCVGRFLNVGYAPGSFFKATLDGGAVIEIVTLGLQTISYWGACHVE